MLRHFLGQLWLPALEAIARVAPAVSGAGRGLWLVVVVGKGEVAAGEAEGREVGVAGGVEEGARTEGEAELELESLIAGGVVEAEGGEGEFETRLPAGVEVAGG
jgi:hypothetical protein